MARLLVGPCGGSRRRTDHLGLVIEKSALQHFGDRDGGGSVPRRQYSDVGGPCTRRRQDRPRRCRWMVFIAGFPPAKFPMDRLKPGRLGPDRKVSEAASGRGGKGGGGGRKRFGAPRRTPSRRLAASPIEGLPIRLAATVGRFQGFARSGRDADSPRGAANDDDLHYTGGVGDFFPPPGVAAELRRSAPIERPRSTPCRSCQAIWAPRQACARPPAPGLTTTGRTGAACLPVRGGKKVTAE